MILFKYILIRHDSFSLVSYYSFLVAVFKRFTLTTTVDVNGVITLTNKQNTALSEQFQNPTQKSKKETKSIPPTYSTHVTPPGACIYILKMQKAVRFAIDMKSYEFQTFNSNFTIIYNSISPSIKK